MHLPVLCVAAREEKLALPFIHAFRHRLYMYISSWMNTSLMWGLLMWNSQSDPVPVWEEAEQRVMRHWSSLAWAPVCFSWRVRQQESRRKVGRDPTTTQNSPGITFRHIVWFYKYKDEAKLHLFQKKTQKKHKTQNKPLETGLTGWSFIFILHFVRNCLAMNMTFSCDFS